MRRSMNQRFAAGSLLALCVAAAVVAGPAESFAMGPQEMALTGTFLSPAQKGMVNTYVLYVRHTPLRFLVTKADITTPQASALTGLDFLERIGAPRITVVGHDKDIERLLQPDVVGKTFILNGALYVDDGVFQLVSLSEVPQKK